MPDNPPTASPPKLLDQIRHAVRTRHYSRRTETAYVDWIRRFILFHDKRHPRDMGKAEVEAFLTSLAVDRNVSASTQNQALAAILFLYREVLARKLDWLDNVTRARDLISPLRRAGTKESGLLSRRQISILTVPLHQVCACVRFCLLATRAMPAARSSSSSASPL